MALRIDLLAAALLLASSPLALAGDADYCLALAEKYETYLANMTSAVSPQQDSVAGRVALEQCKKGNAAGIPVLEQKLRNAKIDLPPRG